MFRIAYRRLVVVRPESINFTMVASIDMSFRPSYERLFDISDWPRGSICIRVSNWNDWKGNVQGL